MTKFFLRLAQRRYEDPNAPEARSACGKMAGLVGIGCNLLLFLAKLLVGLLAGFVSITADAVNNLSDASGSIVTLVGFRLAEKPADAAHPYGHARIVVSLRPGRRSPGPAHRRGAGQDIH